MKRKRRRLYFVLGALGLFGAAAGLALYALNDTLIFFYSPSDLKTKQVTAGRTIRLGGLVDVCSVEKAGDSDTVKFRITDGAEVVAVSYRGLLPDLFREGQGVITLGKMDDTGAFVADEVLAKHDETYMPAEVVDALKKSGHWKEGAAAAPEGVDSLRSRAMALLQAQPAGATVLPPEFADLVKALRSQEPDDPLSLLYCGMIEKEAGNISGARAMWQRLRARLPADSPDRIDIQRRLNELGAGS